MLVISKKGDRRFAFLLNYSGEQAAARLLKDAEDLLEGVPLQAGDLTIEPYGVRVLALN